MGFSLHPGVVQRGRQPPQPRRLVVVPGGHPRGSGSDQLWAPRPAVGVALGGTGLGPGRNQQEQSQRWAALHLAEERRAGPPTFSPELPVTGATCTVFWGWVGSSWSVVEPPTSENGILHVSAGVGVVWAVTKDRKVGRGPWGLGPVALFNIEGCVVFCSRESGPHPLGQIQCQPGTMRVLLLTSLVISQMSGDPPSVACTPVQSAE